jgi:hypothetical protein
MPTPALVPVASLLRRAAHGLALLVLAFVAGCQTATVVKIDALAQANPTPAGSYAIRNRNPLLTDDSLRYLEAVGYVKTALASRGLHEAGSGVKPDLIVDLDFGLGPPQIRRETNSEALYISLPGPVRTHTVQTGVDSQGRPIYQTVMVQEPPSQHFAGYRDYQITTVHYVKHLRLTARQNTADGAGQPAAEVWTIEATSEGESHDLRKILPVLVAATIDFVGQNSDGQKTVRLHDDDKNVTLVKRGR